MCVCVCPCACVFGPWRNKWWLTAGRSVNKTQEWKSDKSTDGQLQDHWSLVIWSFFLKGHLTPLRGRIYFTVDPKMPRQFPRCCPRYPLPPKPIFNPNPHLLCTDVCCDFQTEFVEKSQMKPTSASAGGNDFSLVPSWLLFFRLTVSASFVLQDISQERTWTFSFKSMCSLRTMSSDKLLLVVVFFLSSIFKIVHL